MVNDRIQAMNEQLLGQNNFNDTLVHSGGEGA